MLAERTLRSYRWAVFCLVCLFGPALGATAQPMDRQEVELKVALGEQLVLPAQGVKSYSEGTRSIVDVRLTGDASRFVVVGLNRGVTTLLFLMADGTERHYRITV